MTILLKIPISAICIILCLISDLIKYFSLPISPVLGLYFILRRNGTTCGLTWETMKWLTSNSSDNLLIGRSLSRLPSLHLRPERIRHLSQKVT
jgi:hypothetical protein